MFSLEFDKQKLTNLEFCLSKELVRTSKTGAFASTTIIGCNTRKYHGLLICPQPSVDEEMHVLLSAIDESIVQRDAEFNLGIHKYPGTYSPKGHKYLREFRLNPAPKTTYQIGGVVFSKEIAYEHDEDRVIIKYTLEEAHSTTKLRLKPYLAYRNAHQLSKANNYAERKYSIISNGVKMRMYVGYSYLHMQSSKPMEYVHVPDWYYNVEYMKEAERGYDCHEDLYVPGYFEATIEKGESIYFSVGLTEINPNEIKRTFEDEIKSRIPRDSFENCLRNSAQQFIAEQNNKTIVKAGFPWFGRWGRDTFISTPGLTLTMDNPEICKDIIDSMITDLQGALFPNMGTDSKYAYNSVDAPLWFFWALQKLTEYTETESTAWVEYGEKMEQILNGLRNGSAYNIKMLDNGLLYQGEPGVALTWMDAVVCGKPVTPRSGLAVEINALWYNAIRFSLKMASIADNNAFLNRWQQIPGIIEQSFKDTFWDKDKGYLADCVNGDYKDWSVRPNMVFATSLPYSPISEQIRKLVLDKIGSELLTPRGLRTLSPKDPNYRGIYYGNQQERDSAYHQGTVWPWLLGHYAEGYLKINGKAGVSHIRSLYEGFQETLMEHGLCSISEIFDGDPPHKAEGCISQAWSVAELLRINSLLEEYSNKSMKRAC